MQQRKTVWRIMEADSEDRTSFDFFVKPKVMPKLAFGSATSREVLKPGASRLDRVNTKGVNNPELGPGCYYRPPLTFEEVWRQIRSRRDQAMNKRANKKTSCVSDQLTPDDSSEYREESLMEKWGQQSLPGPGEYEPYMDKPPKMNYYGFNSTVPRTLGSPPKNTPGVNIYHVERATGGHSLTFNHSFGGPITIDPATCIRCMPSFVDYCKLCKERPPGDYYFSQSRSIPLCQRCYENQLVNPRRFTRYQLEKFKTARFCNFLHLHKGKAVKVLMPKKKAKNLMIKETYLATFPPSTNLQNIITSRNTRKSCARRCKLHSQLWFIKVKHRLDFWTTTHASKVSSKLKKTKSKTVPFPLDVEGSSYFAEHDDSYCDLEIMDPERVMKNMDTKLFGKHLR